MAIAMAFFKKHALTWWIQFKEKNVKMVANLSWANFEGLLSDGFILEY